MDHYDAPHQGNGIISAIGRLLFGAVALIGLYTVVALAIFSIAYVAVYTNKGVAAIIAPPPTPAPPPTQIDARPPAPLVIVIEQATVAYAPGGVRVALPAGSEIDVCVLNNTLMVYDLEAMAMRVPQPCTERPLFVDSFEGDPPQPERPR